MRRSVRHPLGILSGVGSPGPLVEGEKGKAGLPGAAKNTGDFVRLAVPLVTGAGTSGQ